MVLTGLGVVATPLEHALQVLVQADLQRGLAVAEQVVGGARLRRDVVPATLSCAGNVMFRVGASSAGPDGLLGEAVGEVVVADAERQRQPIERPPILRVDAEVVVDVRRASSTACAKQRDLVRHAVVEAIADRLERVRSGSGRPRRCRR